MAGTALETSFRDAPFDALADTYDQTFTFSRIGRAQREAVTREMDRVLRPGQRVLEINCGTGVDALHLATRGVAVLACDVAPRMIEVARQRADKARREGRLQAPIEFRVLAAERIALLRDASFTTQFDGVLSNFAGLNCVAELSAVARDLATLLKPGAKALLCLFGRLCAWEVLWYLSHGNPGKAFRRLRPATSVVQLADGAPVRVRYFSIRELRRSFSPHFRLESWKGIGVAVPPSYMEPWAQRLPSMLNLAAYIDQWLGRCPLMRTMSDHVLLTFERTPRDCGA
jgi:ubiquinone/menaquinone biosynthesis C-methylase UbiE